MNETEFNALADAALVAIVTALESRGVDCDYDFKGDGVLELEFEDGNKIIINRHSAAREIWVAEKSGGYHFRFDGVNWVNTREGSELFAFLSHVIAERSGRPVVLRAT